MVLLLWLASGAALGQNLISPEVHGDRRVTFRLEAPKATKVQLWGEWILRNATVEALQKDEKGVWSATIGPLAPAIYSYVFLIDELAVLDPVNPALRTGREGSAGSFVEVRAQTPQPYDLQPVPHGVVHQHVYAGSRQVFIYTPPGYERDPRVRYPVLYLLHGSGDTEREWTSVGRANFIADNLIAQKLSKPMIVVMPDGHLGRKRFQEDLANELIPYVDATYRTLPNRKNRAIAGLSMGAYQAMWFAMDHPELVSALGVFSGGVFIPVAEGEAEVARYAKTQNHPLDLLRIEIGDRDMNLKLSQRLTDVLTVHQVRHEFRVTQDAGHTWPFWRRCLADFLPALFR